MSPKGRDGRVRPLDLTLERDGGGDLSPANGLVGLKLGHTIGGGLSVGDGTFTPVSDEPSAPSRRVGHSAFYADVLRDTDFTVIPLATGAEAMWLLRSASSPESLTLKADLPDGQQLHLEDQGGVTLRDAQNRIAGQVLPPAAVDADGTRVPVTTTVVGDQVRIAIEHRALDVHYPLLVDPTITVSYGGTSGATGKFPGWTPTSYNTSGSAFDFGTPVGVVPLRVGTVTNSTFKYARSSRGVWAYKAPGSSYVYEMDLGSVYNVLGSGGGQAGYGLFNASDDVQGVSTIKGGWYKDPALASVGTNPGVETVAVTNQPRRVCTYTAAITGGAPCPDPGIGGTYGVQQGNRAVMAHILSKALTSSTGTEYTTAQSVALYFGDKAAPSAPTATPPAGWVGTVPASLSVTAAQAGAGLGSTTLAMPASSYTTAHTSPCPGNASTAADNYAPCVQRDTFAMPLPSSMPQGSNAFTAQTASATGVLSTTLTGTIKVDTSAPTLALSGSMYAARNTTVSTASALDLHAAATDGDAATVAAQRSGVASVAATLDGTAMTGGSASQSCTAAAGSCPLNLDVSLTSAQLATLAVGSHTVLVTTTDVLNHTTSSSFSFTTAAPAPPAGPADGGCQPSTPPSATPAPTHVTGHITGNITWKAACSPFVTDGDVVIDAGASLTIEPGATIELDAQTREFLVRGSLTAQGTSEAPVVFTSIQGAAGSGAPSQWYDLRLDGGTAVFDYADIRYRGYGSAVYAYGSLVADNGATLKVSHSRIAYGGQSAGVFAEHGSTATVSDSTLDHNGDGVSVNDASMDLVRNTITDNTDWGIDVPAPVRAGGEFSVFKNNITNNAVGGIRAQSIDCATPLAQWPHGSRNNISGNGAQSYADGSQFRTQYCQAIHVDWDDNYWGVNSYYQKRQVSQKYSFGTYAQSIHEPGYLASTGLGQTAGGWNPGPITTDNTGNENVWNSNYSALTEHPYNSIYVTPPAFQPGQMAANDPLPRGSAADGGSNPAAPNQIHGCEGDPVVCSTGEFTESYADLDAGGRGVGLLFGRTYNAQAAASSTSSGAMGWGWSFAFSDHLEISASSGAVTVHHANGSTVRFDRLSDGTYGAARWVHSRLTKGQSGDFKYRLPDQTLWTFSSAGVLRSVADRNDNTVTLGYGPLGLSVISDAANRSISIDHNPDGTISRATAPSGRHADFAYDATQHLISAADVGGKTTSFAYDSIHRLTQITDPRGGTLVNTYDNDDRVTSQTDPAGRSTTFAYYPDETRVTGPAGDMTRETFKGTLLQSVTKGYGTAAAATATIGYDADLNATSTTDPKGKDSSFTYDSDGNQLTVTDPLSRTSSYSYNTRHDITSVTAPSGRISYFDRDSTGNLTAVRRTKTETGQEQKTSYGYDTFGQLISVTDPLNHTTTTAYDNAGSVVSTTSELGSKTTNTYDADERLLTTTAPLGNVAGATAAHYTTTYDRDAYGNLKTITDGFNKPTAMLYDDNQNLTDVTDAVGRHTQTEFDADDEPRKVHRPDGTVVETTYDGAGRVLTQIDGRLKTTTYAYDDLGRVKTITDPLNRATQYGYDAVGNLTTVTDASNRVVTQSYDAARQLRTRSYSTGRPGNVTYDYDVDGRRTTMTDELGTTTSSYDSLDRLTSQTNARSETTGYGWDLAGRSVRLTLPGGDAVTRDYDNDDRLKSVTDWLAHTSTFSYDANDNLTTVNRANGANSTYSYDRLDQLLTITDPVAGDRSYGRNDTSQLNSTTFASGAPKVSDYDPNGRLKSHGPDAYSFDTADDLTQTLDRAGTAVKQTFDDANQLIDSKDATTNTTSASFNYDVLGQRQNQTASGVVTNYEYDQAGQLSSYSGPDLAASGTTTETYSYDGDGLRQSRTVGSSTLAQGYDLSQALPQLVQNGTTRFVSGPGGLPLEEITGTTVRYFHQDQLGSTVALSDATGAKVSSFDYDAYGNPRGPSPAVPTVYGYAGQVTDSHSGLQYLRARYYDPVTGQFLTRDPLVSTTRLAYGYTPGDPLNLADPTGLLFGGIQHAASAGLSFAGNAVAGGLDGFTGGASTSVLAWAGAHPDTCSAAFSVGQAAGVASIFVAPGYAELRASGLGVRAGLRLLASGGASAARKEAGVVGEYLAMKAPRQVTPGTRVLEGVRKNNQGRVEPWKAHYDEHGRLVGRTDYNAGNTAKGIADTHHHRYEYGPGYGHGREVESHVPGEYIP